MLSLWCTWLFLSTGTSSILQKLNWKHLNQFQNGREKQLRKINKFYANIVSLSFAQFYRCVDVTVHSIYQLYVRYAKFHAFATYIAAFHQMLLWMEMLTEYKNMHVHRPFQFSPYVSLVLRKMSIECERAYTFISRLLLCKVTLQFNK